MGRQLMVTTYGNWVRVSVPVHRSNNPEDMKICAKLEAGGIFSTKGS